VRQAINNNPVVQIGVLGGLALIVAVFFMMTTKKGSSDSGSTASSAAPAPATSTPPAAGTGSVAAGSPSAPATGSAGAVPSAPPTTSGTVSPDALIPGPGLPKPVITAWKRGDAVVLLVVRQGGIDDRLVRNSVRSLSEPGVSVFVTKANQVARYSRITQGVGVSQAPALVVVRPKRVSGSVPEAQVSYGFRDSQGVVQAVHDAVYGGKDNLPYSPR
jgi:hypothetical protein